MPYAPRVTWGREGVAPTWNIRGAFWTYAPPIPALPEAHFGHAPPIPALPEAHFGHAPRLIYRRRISGECVSSPHLLV